MAALSSTARLARKHVRYTMDVHIGSADEKQAFLGRLQTIRQRMTPAGSPPLDNYSLLCTMFDIVEGTAPASHSDSSVVPTTSSFLGNSGKYNIYLMYNTA